MHANRRLKTCTLATMACPSGVAIMIRNIIYRRTWGQQALLHLIRIDIDIFFPISP